ncbi:MAG: hypothetical protein ACTHWM_06590 [Yaniella sp.]|uniref:hypothetical protein n=1 Tax=Yaniella sp. TaxID=2773929 RepID=UPI003F953BF0
MIPTNSVYATGRALLIDAWVDISYVKGDRNDLIRQLHAAIPNNWRPGPLSFGLREAEKASEHIRSNEVVDELERSENFSTSTAKILYGRENSDGVVDRVPLNHQASTQGNTISLRHHTVDVAQLDTALELWTGDYGPPTHEVIAAELVFAPSYASAPQFKKTISKQHGTTITARRRAILTLHLGYRGSTNPDDDPALTQADAEWFYQTFRVAENRLRILERIQEALDINPKSGLRVIARPEETLAAHEYFGTIYPVLTDLNLNLFRDDTDALLIRELATVTRSDKHGTKGATDKAKRVERTRQPNQRIGLSESWAVMPTGHGTLFFGISQDEENSFPEARLYVSALYIDYIAIVRLEALIAKDFWQRIQDSIQSADDLDIEDALTIRRRLMGLRSSYSKVGHGENNIGARLAGAMRTSLRSEAMLTDIVDEATAIVEIAELKQSKKDEHSATFLQWALGIITIVGLPLAGFDAAVTAHSHSTETAITFWVLFAVVIVAACITLLTITKRMGSKRLDDGDE